MSSRAARSRVHLNVGSVTATVFVILLAVFPLWMAGNERWMFIGVQALLFVLAALGLNVLIGQAGVISAGHGALFGTGAYVGGVLMVEHGMPFWLAVLAGTIAGGFVSFVLGLPTGRIASWYFVLITLLAAETAQALMRGLRSITKGDRGLLGVPPPTVFGKVLDMQQMFWFFAAIVVLAMLLLRNLLQSRVGTAFAAMRLSEPLALANGAPVRRLRLLAFVLAGLTAGAAGSFFASLNAVVTPENFGTEFSLFFTFIVILGGSQSLWGPVLGVFGYAVAPDLIGSAGADRTIVYGVLLLVVMSFVPSGLAGGFNSLHARLKASMARQPRATDRSPVPGALPDLPAGADVHLRDVSKSFNGVDALADIGFSIEAGTVHAIVGPNGSGKTTLVNILSGVYRPTTGTVEVAGHDVGSTRPERLAAIGIARTFQTPQLMPGVTCLRQVRLGAYSRVRSSMLAAVLRTPAWRREDRELDDEALACLELVGLLDHEGTAASELPHGQQRMLEIARAVMSAPRLLLLDEPAAGLALDELRHLERLLEWLRDTGVTVVIVEHHMDLVGNVADLVTVLDAGVEVVTDRPEAVFQDARVIEAYLGVAAS